MGAALSEQTGSLSVKAAMASKKTAGSSRSLRIRVRSIQQVGHVGVQRRRPAGVHEENVLVLLEKALPRQVNQSGHRFTRVDGIEQNSLRPCQHPDRFH